METNPFRFLIFMVMPFIALSIVYALHRWVEANDLQVWTDLSRPEGLITFLVVVVTWVVAMGFFIASDFKDN